MPPDMRMSTGTGMGMNLSARHQIAAVDSARGASSAVWAVCHLASTLYMCPPRAVMLTR